MTGNALHNGLKRVFVGLIIVAIIAQPIAPVVGSATAQTNTAPEPNIEAPSEAGQNVPITFSAEGTRDDTTSYENLTFRWDFDGDGQDERAGPNPTYEFTSAGEFEVRLSVEDEDGLTESTTHSIRIGEDNGGGELSNYQKAALVHPAGAVMWAATSIFDDDQDRVNSISETSASSRRIMMYQNGLSQREFRRAFEQVMANYGKDSEALASQDAKYAIAEAYSNGADLSTAENKSVEAIEDRFARMQLQIIERYEARVAQMDYHTTIALSDDDIGAPGLDGWNGNLYYSPMIDANMPSVNWKVPMRTGTQQTTLANGTKVNYTTIGMEMSTNDATDDRYTWTMHAFPNYIEDAEGDSDRLPSNMGGRGPSYILFDDGDYHWNVSNTISIGQDDPDEYPDRTMMEPEEWWEMFVNFNQSSEELVTQYENYTAEKIYLALEDGEVEPTDVYSPETMIREMSGDDPQNMTDYGMTLATLSSLGLNHTDLNQSAKMVIDMKGVSLPKPSNVSETHVTTQSVNDTTSVIVSSGYNVTLENHLRTWGVFAEYDDGRRVRIPRDQYEIKSGSEYVVEEWNDRPNGTVSNVSVEILDSSGLSEELEKVYFEDNVTGMVFADNLPENGSFEVGKTYHTGNLEGMVVISDMNGTLIDLKGQFTIEEAYAPDGTTVENVSWEEFDYEVESSDDFVNQTEWLTEHIKVVIERENEIVSGGGGGDSTESSLTIPDLGLPSIFGIPGWVILVLLVIVAIVILS